jgi:putative nucleotidyltransferase with HDIG domain
MKMAGSQEIAVDEEKVKKAIQSGIPLTITTFTLPHEIEIYIEQLLAVFLKFVDQAQLKDYIVYIIQELAVNAKKANTKRVYFLEKNLNLEDPEDYKAGMENFKEETLGNIAHYLQIQKEKGLYIKLILQAKRDIIFIEVRNNVAVTKTELIRIHDKLARSRQFDSLEDALSQVLDSSEGAGLGLVILVLMLKKMGLDEDCFDILSTEKETIARIIIPLAKTKVENLAILSNTIVNSVNSLPQFPENILRIQQLIADPDSDMGSIARQISMDPAMTADLLKLVNSAQYMMAKKVDNIFEAAKMVGIKGIRNLLYSYGTQKILGDDTDDKRKLWKHSHQVGFYAYNLARNFHSKDRTVLDDAHVAGILHDMGKIIFSKAHPELLDKIRNFCIEKGLPASTFEELSAGMNHAEIGALVAEKWNFPESLVCAIRYHHDPFSAPQEFRALTETVYLANMLCEYENGAVDFEQFESPVLEAINLSSKERLDAILLRFQKDFQNEV